MAQWARANGMPVACDGASSSGVIRLANALLEARDAVAGLDEAGRGALRELDALMPALG